MVVGKAMKSFGDESGLASLGVLHWPPHAGDITYVSGLKCLTLNLMMATGDLIWFELTEDETVLPSNIWYWIFLLIC